MAEITGWLLDVYESANEGVTLWLLAGDGRRLRLHHPFPVRFLASGPPGQLRRLWCWLAAEYPGLRLAREERRDLFQTQPVSALAVETDYPARLPLLFRETQQRYPDLTYYDADLALSLRYAAASGAFPLAHCRVQAAENGRLLRLDVLDTPWDLEPAPAPLRILELEPECDPAHAPPRALLARFERREYRLSLDPPRALLVNLRALLERIDPDVLLTAWGDTWLLPLLLELSQRWRVPLPLNREPGRGVTRRAERSYFSYGQIVYSGQQIHLFGRWHIDRRNATLWSDYGLPGVLEAARVTALPVQTAARTSPGTGISSMQVTTALRDGILVPWHKQQAEQTKTALDLLRRDQGGLIYQPLVGLHRDVGEIDFISMYPSIMVHCNISPETPFPTQLEPSDAPPGLVPRTLDPLLQKRVALKRRLLQLSPRDARREDLRARSSAHKWLLVTCFGYLGYKNARFGRIEAHEAVTTWGREALLRAKEAAEDAGFEILHMYVDGLWLEQPGINTPAAYQPLLDEIERRTGLPIALDGIFRWVVFLPSRVDARVPVANRYFGVFQDGTLKVRGLEARRRDTPAWIAAAQMELLECLAQAGDADVLPARLPLALTLLRRRLTDLRARRVPLEDLLVAQKLSREPGAYAAPSPGARAALQLAAAGKTLRPGQRVRFLHVRGGSGVHAWDLPGPPPDAARLDVARYADLLLRAAAAVLQPFGVDEPALHTLIDAGVRAVPLFTPRARAKPSTLPQSTPSNPPAPAIPVPAAQR